MEHRQPPGRYRTTAASQPAGCVMPTRRGAIFFAGRLCHTSTARHAPENGREYLSRSLLYRRADVNRACYHAPRDRIRHRNRKRRP